MKKIIAILCALAMILSAASCMAEVAEAPEEINVPVIEEMKQFDIPDNEALRFVREMKTGWNLGNTFDAFDDDGWFTDPEPMMEMAWHGMRTKRELMANLKEAGFNTIRIPVSWHNHVDENYTIHPDWLARVKEVVGWAVDEGLYVIVNVHHDNTPNKNNRYFYPDSAHYDQSAAYLGAIWQQMADAFAEFDEHVILESMNEPRLVGTNYEWNFVAGAEACQDAAECINKLNQLFVDTVRATGGNNATRYLLVPGYCAAPSGVTNKYFRMPEDTADNRIILEVHAYTPYDFALNKNGYSNFSLENKKRLSEVAGFMNKLYENYVSQGIPVVIDEYGAMDKGNLQDRVNFVAYYLCAASARGITCCWWDNGAFGGDGEIFGIINRSSGQWKYPEIVEAIMANCTFNR